MNRTLCLSRRLALVVLAITLSACAVRSLAPTPVATLPAPSNTATLPAPAATLPPVTTVTPTAPALLAGVWQLVRIEYMSGKVVSIEKPESYTAQFQGDGRLAIKADCNSGGGTFQVSGQILTVSRLVTTLMACPPGSLDTQFTKGLSNAASFVLEGEELTISMAFDGGQLVFRKAR